jgi:protein TonB
MSASVSAWVPTSKSQSQSIWSSLGSALLIELGVVGAVMAWLFMHPPQELQEVIPLVMSVLEESKVEKPQLPKPPEVKPLPRVPKTLTAAQVHTPLPLAPVPADVRPVEEPAMPVVGKPTAFSTPAAPSLPPAPAVSSPSQPTVDPAIAYNSKLATAVQAAFVVPGSASALSFKGRARVEFHLRDGVASNAKIIQPSGLGAVDRAALKAVETAAFPAPPAALVGKEGVYQIWVACF